jgi:hypothetical protein
MIPKDLNEIRTKLKPEEMASYETLLASMGAKKGPYTRILILRELEAHRKTDQITASESLRSPEDQEPPLLSLTKKGDSISRLPSRSPSRPEAALAPQKSEVVGPSPDSEDPATGRL